MCFNDIQGLKKILRLNSYLIYIVLCKDVMLMNVF